MKDHNNEVNIKNLTKRLLMTMPLALRRDILFFVAHRRFPRKKNPVTFSEKINWRILYDKTPDFNFLCDKQHMKETVSNSEAPIKHVPTIWKGTDILTLDTELLPKRWVLKPNHLSGGKIYVGTGKNIDHRKLNELINEWQKDKEVINYLGEWGYSGARTFAIIEPWIGGPTESDFPHDFKIFVFHGKPVLIQVHSGRASNHELIHMSPKWEKLNVRTSISTERLPERPMHLEGMLETASQIAHDIDFLRVDFYETDYGTFFGEVAVYPASGFRKFSPASFDRQLGKYWRIEK